MWEPFCWSVDIVLSFSTQTDLEQANGPEVIVIDKLYISMGY